MEVENIQENGPFLSTHSGDDSNKHKFLGTGYYFWDNNLNIAHSYGVKNLKSKYHIYKAEIETPRDLFLDLAGNRIHMQWFQEVMDRFRTQSETAQWPVGAFIEFLKQKSLFPYRAIRALDYTYDTRTKVPFVQDRNSFINLTPVMIVCLIDKRSDMLLTFDHYTTR